MAAPLATGLTVADLDRYDEDERHKYELVDGELFMSPKGLPRHQWVATRIARRLLDWADEHGAAAFVEPDLYVDDRSFVIPDVVLLAAEALRRLDPRRIELTPDLLVEVSSPSTRRLDVVVKRALYERIGVPEYWFVDLDADRIEVYRLVAETYGGPALVGRDGRLDPPHLPGLTVEVADVLRPIVPDRSGAEAG
jgi:Uma2 family endonuclease